MSFWRFGNGYNEVSAINTLLEKAFLDDPSSTTEKTRKSSLSSTSSTDSEQHINDSTVDEEHDYNPNLAILGRLLDEQELMDELTASNIKLIEYLRHTEVLDKLVSYITTEESNDEDELKAEEERNELNNEDENNENDKPKSIASDSDSDVDIDLQNFEQPETPQEIHSRRAQVAAQILSAGAWSLTDAFMDNYEILAKLWGILDNPCPLSMVLSTYFMKINEHLLDMKIDEMLNFILQQKNIVDRFLRHIDNPPLMDFLLKVISTDKPDSPTGIIELLKEQELIPKLIAFLDPKIHPSIQSAAGDFIKAFVTISANSNTDDSTIGPNELTRELVSTDIMNKLCSLMLNGGTSLANGVGIIIEIIRKNNSDYDFVPVLFITIESHPPKPRDPIYLGYLIQVFSKNIPKFTEMLKETKLENLETPFGNIEPLGFERFKICELIAELLHCSNMGLLNDEKGEDIVTERNIERERLIALEKQHQNLNDDQVNDDLSKDVKGLNLSGEETEGDETLGSEVLTGDLSINSEDLGEKSSPPEKEFITIEKKDTSRDSETTDGENTDSKSTDSKDTDTNEHLESERDKVGLEIKSEPDSDVDTNVEYLYEEQELELRKNAVVGDQLKIVLIDNRVILEILNMFFRFPWNNFLHNVVFDIVQQILNGSMDIGYNKYLAIDLFGRGEINKAIIKGQNDCEDYEENHGLRLGYMGHLTLIAEEVVKFTALYPPSSVHQIVTEAVSAPEWTHYVTETLVETREKYNALLGGDIEGLEDDTREEYENVQADDERQFKLDPSVDHDIVGSGYEEEKSLDDNKEDDKNDSDDGQGDQFSRYMSQQLTSDLRDKFGSSDEDDEDDDLIGWNNQHYSPHQLPVYGDDDDYVDPNDDGQVYTKNNHPLYSKMLSSNGQSGFAYEDDDQLSDNDDFEGEEYDDDVGDEGDKDGDGYTLSRSKSKGELSWDDEEQSRLMNMANYIKKNAPSSSK